MTKEQEQLNLVAQNLRILDNKINMLFSRQDTMEQTTIKGDPTVPHQLILERAIGGYVITVGRDGTRIVCPDITKAFLSLADYCEETVIVNGETNDKADEEDE